MQSVHGTSVKSMEVDGNFAHQPLRESTATRVINASGRHVMFAVTVLLLAFLLQTVPTTLLVIFTRDLKAKLSDSSVSGHSGGSVDFLADQQGAPVTSGNTLFQFGLVDENAVAVRARDLVNFNEDPHARIGSFANSAHRGQFLSAIDTINIGFLAPERDPVTLTYHVLGVVTAKERVTFKLNGATGELDLHLFKEGEEYASRVGQADYFGPGAMNDGTQCICPGDRKMAGADDREHCQDDQGKAVKPVSSKDQSVDCERPYMSPQEARVCSADPDIVCAERSPATGTPWGRPNPGCAWGRCGGRMLEEGKPQRRKLCATCVAVGAAVAGGVASGVAGGVTAERRPGQRPNPGRSPWG